MRPVSRKHHAADFTSAKAPDHVAQAISEQVETQDRHDDGRAGGNRQVRSIQQDKLPLGKHGAPIGSRGLHPKPEE
mgnify:CR=1 FL=1